MTVEEQNTEINKISSILDSSRAGTRHAEMVTQTRLYNFLFCDSILILAWATVFSSSDGNRSHVLVILSALSFILSVVYAVLGHRGDAFIKMHYDVDASLESRLPEEFQLTKYVMTLQQGRVYVCTAPNRIDDSIQIPKWEIIPLISSHLLVAVPTSLAFVSLFLLAVSLGSPGVGWLVVSVGLVGAFLITHNRDGVVRLGATATDFIRRKIFEICSRIGRKNYR